MAIGNATGTPYFQTAYLASRPIFNAPLTQGITLQNNSTPANFTRATTASVIDYEGIVRTAQSDEPRFKGARRVENLITASEDMTNGAYSVSNNAVVTNATTATYDGTTNGQVNGPTATIVDDGGGVGSRTFIYSVKIRLVSGTISADDSLQLFIEGSAIGTGLLSIGDQVTSVAQRFTISEVIDAAGTEVIPRVRWDDAGVLEITEWQLEETTGQEDTTTPSEYVSTGVGTGPELITNGTFDTDTTGWTPLTSATLSVVNETLRITNVGSNFGKASQEITTVPGKNYILLFKGVGGTSLAKNFRIGTFAGATDIIPNTAFIVGNNISIFTAISTSSFLSFVNDPIDTSFNDIDNVSVKEVSHGANIDGVQYFNTNNGNTVTDDVVTEANGEPINLVNNPKQVNLDGVSGSFVSSPNSAAASVTGDIDIRAFVNLDNWTPSSTKTVIGKFQNTKKSYRMDVDTIGAIGIILSIDGSSNLGQTSTAVTGFTDGTAHGIRVTLDADDGDGNNVIEFFTRSDDNISSDTGWDKLGNTITSSGAIIIDDNTSDIEIGSVFEGTLQNISGSVNRAQIYNGIDGTLVVDFNASDHINGASTLTSSNTGEVWTLNGGAIIPNAYYDSDGPFGYMSEAASTNLISKSEEFAHTDWMKSGTASVVENSAIAPDGKTTANTVSLPASVDFIQNASSSITGGTAYAASIYAKKNTGKCTMRFQLSTSLEKIISVINTATKTLTFISASAATHISSTVQNINSEWDRYIIVGSLDTTTATAGIMLVNESAGETGIIAWGAQIEESPFPTSYIPTTTTAVTRNKDVLLYDSAGNIFDAAGTAFACSSTDWGSAPETSYVLARNTNARILYRVGDLSSNVIQIAGATGNSASVSGQTMQNLSQNIASSWGNFLTAYSPGNLEPDLTPASYDGTIGTGDIGIGVRNDGIGQWSGTVRGVKIFRKELNKSKIQNL